ncbi:MAG: SusE domain-containing protein [Alistipes sp.]
MKVLKYLVAFAVLALSFVGCDKDTSEDAFSTAPVAPVLNAHADILMTKNTMDEGVTFSWQAARFIGEDITYSFYAKYNGTAQKMGSTEELFFTLDKTAFKEKLYTLFPTLPVNSTFSVMFYVVAENGSEKSYSSEELSNSIYAYGDYVSPEPATDTPSELLLDETKSKENITIIKWTPALLNYNETATYSVFASYIAPAPASSRAAAPDMTLLKKDLTGTSLSMNVDEFNEMMLSMGVPEAATSTVKLYVFAYSESVTEGVSSPAHEVAVTTYLATFPAAMYVIGSHQGWNPGAAPQIPMSTLQKGYYEGFLDLTDSGGGASTSFKVSPEPAWGKDVGSIDMKAETIEGNDVISGTLVAAPDNNITVPNGVYRICIDKKAGTILLVKVVRMGMIGEATPTGWNTPDTEMTYNNKTNTYSAVIALTTAKEYKFRLNNAWKFAIGNNFAFDGGQNFMFDKPTGTYQVVLDVNAMPYKVAFNSVAYPFCLNLTGDTAVSTHIYPSGADGQYDGIVEIGTAVSFTAPVLLGSPWSAKSWYLTSGVYDEGNALTNYVLAETGAAAATTKGWACVKADLTANTASIFPITRIGLIGTFNGWGAPDAAFTYDKVKDEWTVKGVVFAEPGEYKVRFNDDWKLDIAGDATDLIYKGGNLKMSKAGTFDFVLKVSKHPFTLTYTKSK